MVDKDFLAKLLEGSFETATGAVIEAVEASPQLFGVADKSDVRVCGTYPDHAIVANAEGTFFRASWHVTEEGEVQIEDVETLDVPVYEMRPTQSLVRSTSMAVVEAMLECNEGAVEEKLRVLTDLVSQGVPMTAEAVEARLSEANKVVAESDWRIALQERSESIRRFLGPEVLRLPSYTAKFSALTGPKVEESAAESHRSEIISSIVKLQSELSALKLRSSDSRLVSENYHVRGQSEPGTDEVLDFVGFATSYGEDLDGMIGVVEDALAVSEDGCAQCLARFHDAVAENMNDWVLAAAFTEKLARKFEAPKAAAA